MNDLTGQIIGVAGFILGVLGIIMSLIIYRTSKRVKEPLWSIKNTLALPENLSSIGIKLSYHDKYIENIAISHVYFWNNGTQPITKSDIEGAIRVVFDPKSHILDASIVGKNPPSMDFTISLDTNANACNLDFQFLNRYDGVAIRIIHTGNQSTTVYLEGRIIGVSNITYVQELNKFLPKQLLSESM